MSDYVYEPGDERVIAMRRLDPDGNGQLVEVAPEPVRTLRLHVTQERVERLKFGLMRKSQQGDLDAMARLLAWFAFDGSRYMSEADVVDILDELERKQIHEMVNTLMDRIEQVSAGGDPN